MVHALRRIHAALDAGGVLVDTQPVSPHPPIGVFGRPIGRRIDMLEWSRTIEAVDSLTAETVEAGLYSIEDEQPFTVTDSWDSGPDCAETVAGWQARGCRSG